MKNKITVSIAGQEYTMVAEEAETYVQRCAELADAIWAAPMRRCWRP